MRVSIMLQIKEAEEQLGILGLTIQIRLIDSIDTDNGSRLLERILCMDQQQEMM